jgi:threonine dehydrogenase-like Zn-dependent dehydrogenase
MYGAGDVRVETVPDATLKEPTDALVRVVEGAICGSDLWPFKSMRRLAAWDMNSSESSRPLAPMCEP